MASMASMYLALSEQRSSPTSWVGDRKNRAVIEATVSAGETYLERRSRANGVGPDRMDVCFLTMQIGLLIRKWPAN